MSDDVRLRRAPRETFASVPTEDELGARRRRPAHRYAALVKTATETHRAVSTRGPDPRASVRPRRRHSGILWMTNLALVALVIVAIGMFLHH